MIPFIAGVAVLIIVVLIYKVLYDSSKLDLKYHKIPSKDSSQVHPPLHILYFSDLHWRDLWISQKQILDVLDSRPIDLVLFGGDLDHRYPQKALHWLATFHEALCQQSQQDLPPILGVWGNHDGDIPRTWGQSSAYRFLENERVDLTIHGRNWTILGLADLETSTPDLKKTIGAKPIQEDQSILLAHNPDVLLNIDTPKPLRLALFGHYHDGQIALPGHLEFRLLRRKDKLASEGYISGFYTRKGQDFIISHGIGNTFLPFRFRSHAAIDYIVLE